MITIEQTEWCCRYLTDKLNTLVKSIGPIRIGNKEQFPFGWRKAAKGRTVWRILEEIINQNLEVLHSDLGFSIVEPSPSEVSVYDTRLQITNNNIDIYINVKSALLGGRTNKDDISKAIGLQSFFSEDIRRQLFICTFVVDFNDEMYIDIKECFVMPISWLPDIYVNPSNNGNLQSSKYKNIDNAIRRTNQEFLIELEDEMEVARQKRINKQKKLS